MFNSGGNQTQAKANELVQSAKDAAIGAKDKTVKVAQPKTPLEKAGDQVTNAAQGAVDTVKNTLGIKK